MLNVNKAFEMHKNNVKTSVYFFSVRHGHSVKFPSFVALTLAFSVVVHAKKRKRTETIPGAGVNIS